MPLKTIVKVGSITNLSEARYCAGMGVNLLGFCTIRGKENYLSPPHFQEIRGWITGPQIVAEIYGIQSQAQLESILSDYKPDYLEMGSKELELLTDIPLPFILASHGGSVSTKLPKTPSFVLLKDLSMNILPYPMLIEVQSLIDAQRVLNSPNTTGIAMNGGPEISPGLKEYEVLAEILELLDTD
jgi:phosphoribosylanthranilate isomerase